MARNLGSAGQRTTAVTTAVSFQNLVGGTTIDTVVRDISVSFDGAVVTNAPDDIQVYLATSAGTFPVAAAATTKVDKRSATALIATFGAGIATVEPTAQTQVFRWHIHPQTGLLWQGTPYMDEVVVAGAAAFVGVRHVTAPAASIDIDHYFVFEE